MGDVGLVEMSQALIVTAEVAGHELSPRAAEVMARELLAYPAQAVAGALRRCRREVSGRLTLAAVLQRLDDGRPGPEQAWSLCQAARDEGATVVWTDEMAEAFGAASQLDDDVAARMAFRETYTALCALARDERRSTHWAVSLGHDAARRAEPILDAVERGRLPADALQHVHPGLPDFDRHEPRLLALSRRLELPAHAEAAP